MGDTNRMLGEAMAMVAAARERAERDIEETRAFAARHGLVLHRPSPAPRRERAPHPAAGKSRPQMDQWLRRALEDGTLPRPSENLLLPPAMVRRALALGYVEGEGHPYRATAAGLAFATSPERRRGRGGG